MPTIQEGFNCDVAFIGGVAEKFTKSVYSETEALRRLDDLTLYAQQLQDEPIPIARLLEADLVPTGEGFRIRHTSELIEGQSLVELSGDAQRLALRDAVGSIARMATFSDEITLRTPLDPHPRNFHLGPAGPTLIDVYPPLLRHPNGSIMRECFDSHANYILAKKWYGQQAGAIAHLLYYSIDHGSSLPERYRYAVTHRDSWMYDTLPDNLTGRNRDHVRRQIAARFLPFMIEQDAVRRIIRH